MIYITSDLHDSHSNLCRGTSKWTDKSGCRDFDTIDAMNDAIVESINRKVQRGDTLYHLGDWSFGHKDNVGKLRSRINCENVHLILGNHDKHIKRNIELQKLFSSVDYYHEFYYNKLLICMFHYSGRVWNESHHGSILCYGHSHGTLPGLGRSLDVGWDVHREPLSIDEIYDRMIKVEPHIVDHHNGETS